MNAIKEFRKSIGIETTGEFAEILGVSKSLCEKVESGDREPSREFTKKLKKKYPQFDTNCLYQEHIV